MVTGAEKIILIDDDETFVGLLAKRLAKSGYQTRTFTDPSEAVRQIREAEPDLIISDLRMPGLNGLEVCDLVRKNPDTRNVPIIMITGFPQAMEQIRCMNTNSIFFLQKPVDSESL